MALHLLVREVFVQVPSGWKSLGYFHTKKEAKQRARKETQPTLIEKKII